MFQSAVVAIEMKTSKLKDHEFGDVASDFAYCFSKPHLRILR